MGPIYYKNKFIDLSPVHLRPEIPKMDFSLEYTIVTRFFKGDWKQAAKISSFEKKPENGGIPAMARQAIRNVQ